MNRLLAILLLFSAIHLARAADVMPIWQNDTAADVLSFNDTFGHQVAIGSYSPTTGVWSLPTTAISIGETFTGGLISVAGSPLTGAGGTFALTVAGTSGGIPYFSSASTWASSAALASGSLVQGGGAGVAPSTFTLGGDCTFATPNITCLKTSGVAFGTLATLSAAPAGTLTGATLASNVLASSLTSLGTLSSLTVTGLTTLTGNGNAQTISAMASSGISAPAMQAFYFNTNDLIGSFSSSSTHIAFVIQGGKGAPASNTTGSRETAIVQYQGAGGVSADYFTAAQLTAMPMAGSFANAGNFTGSNPQALIPTGMTPTSAVGEEIDVQTLSNVTNIREGLRIVDLGSTGSIGAGIDAAIGILSSGIGFATGLEFGDAGGANFPIVAGGTLLNTVVSSVNLSAGISLLGLTGTYTFSPILLAANNKGIWWGTTKQGGSIVSETTTGGGDIVMQNGYIGFRFGGTTSVMIEPNVVELTPVTIAALLAITCNSAAEGMIAFVKDTVGSATPTFHLTVAGSGATTVNSLASCNGTNWQYN